MGNDQDGSSTHTNGASEADGEATNQGAPSDSSAPPTVAPPATLRDPEALIVWEAELAVRHAEAERLVTLLRYIDSKTAQARREGREAYEQLQRREASEDQLRCCALSAQEGVDVEERAAIMYAAEALVYSESHVHSLYLSAQRARTELPRVWKAFRAGHITSLALRNITRILNNPLKDETIEKLDAKAPEYAEHHRPGQLHHWLKQFIAKTEPAESAERFTRAAKERRVSVRDLDDGMSLLTAVMPTLTAHCIQEKLEAVARSPKQAVPHNPLIATQLHQQEQRLELTQALHQWMRAGRQSEHGKPTFVEDWKIGQVAQNLARSLQENTSRSGQDIPCADGLHITDGAPIDRPEGPDLPHEQSPVDLPETRSEGDPRNIDQRALDTFTAWLLEAEGANGIEIKAHIGILVPEATVTGASDQPAVSRDGRVVIPGPHIRGMLQTQQNNLKWSEIGIQSKLDSAPGEQAKPKAGPAHGENVLSYHSTGRYPPPRLRTALMFRDGTCVAAGCCTPAERCDIDHITPWPEGATAAENLQVLCRRHHRLKTAGYDIGSRYTQAA